ncbi:MAG: hypothetical protein V3S74_03420 [Alphaproteobacteria bacterium]
MTGDFDPAIQRVIKDVGDLERSLLEKKRFANQLCEYAGRPALYADTEASETVSVGSIRPDQFYGQPLATAIRGYLEMRQTSRLGAAQVREIFEALKAGGFKFEAKDDTNAQRGLRQSLTKNSTTFHRLPNNSYGLLEWYPAARVGRSPGNGDANNLVNKHDTESKSADAEEAPADSASSSDAPANDEEEGVSEPYDERS